MATSIYAKPIKAKTILKFTLPTVLMMVFMSLYTVVDGIVVANCVGSDALSAINIVYPFTLVFMAVGLMFSTGSNAIIAKKMGEGKQEEANRLMSGVAITATVISVIIAVLFTIFAEPMYMMFGSNEKILPYCIDYGSVMIPYGFVMCWQMLNQSYLVTADKPHIMLVFSILSGCTNIVLDILFMAVWDFGIIGAGLGTIIGMAVGAIPLLLFFNKKQTLHFGKPEFKVSEILFAMANRLVRGCDKSFNSRDNSAVQHSDDALCRRKRRCGYKCYFVHSLYFHCGFVWIHFGSFTRHQL